LPKPIAQLPVLRNRFEPELTRLLTMFTAALAVQVGHDRRLLCELLTARAQKVPCLSRNDALVKHLYDDSTLWAPRTGVQLMALGHVLLRFIHSHVSHLASLTAKGPNFVPGVLRLCQLLESGALEYMFLLHKPLAIAAGRGLQVHGARNPLLHSREYYEAALQAFYRDVPGLMFFDYQPESSAPCSGPPSNSSCVKPSALAPFRKNQAHSESSVSARSLTCEANSSLNQSYR